ncbi:MAG: hypothetical protein C5B55_04885 [Blastocatellia bacterium]|nr:MAG: hypothetical protein C5B55_04885 [Blastocatellia bacterium]
MTPEQHNRYLAWSHIAYGGFFMLMMLAFMTFFGIAALSGGLGPGGPPAGFLIFMWLFFGAFYGAMTVPSFIAGYALLKERRWAKTAAIVAGVLAAMSFPMGTAVCVYTFWFLFSEPGKIMFERQRLSLPQRRESWLNQTDKTPTPEYVPPPTPPDWR